jgi:hypothetical protein
MLLADRDFQTQAARAIVTGIESFLTDPAPTARQERPRVQGAGGPKADVNRSVRSS